MKSILEMRDSYYHEGLKSYGENISQIQHAVQVARLAEKQHASDSQIVACLLHDIGHLINEEAVTLSGLDDSHELLGADILRDFFCPDVTEPIRLHVEAKRYLCSVDTNYYEDLSEASKESLKLQGGFFETQNEIKAFEDNLFFREAIQLRQLDDMGKNPDDLRADFDDYIPLLKSLYNKL